MSQTSFVWQDQVCKIGSLIHLEEKGGGKGGMEKGSWQGGKEGGREGMNSQKDH